MSFYKNSSINILNNRNIKLDSFSYRAPAWNNLLILVIKENQTFATYT